MKKVAKTLFLVGFGGALGFIGGRRFADYKWTEIMSDHLEWMERMASLNEGA